MKIATLLFTYNRSYHTEQVLTALKHNTILPQKLFVFQDGLRDAADKDEWEKVDSLIHDIDWCNKEVVISEYNKGLAVSIVSGINYAFEEYDAVIVLEDDCVPAVNFISYMQQCFEKYDNDKRVYSVSGYAFPIDVQKDEYDIYGCGRISSWGWGTWKDRWEIYNRDYEMTKKMKGSEDTSKKLALWGQDLEDTLVGNIRGYCDSWAVFWALNVILKEGICINPYKSLIRNIGTDGSGVHCGVTSQYDVEMSREEKEEFLLPDQIAISEGVKVAFAPLFGSYTAVNTNDDSKEMVLIYGLGNLFFQHEKEINEKYRISAFIDRGKRGWYAGKKIIRMDGMEHNTYDKILILVKDVQVCESIAKELMDCKKVPEDRILFGHNLFIDC